ncbi:MAG: glycosyltransferase [Candidatus Thiocaldithrix dubininis]|uniref:Glycosyltransferase n=1 Tax=Candidatus Thiocaldithrix dubininis TaxID=3080823 RepID=A0AA95KJ51_9GAMM|nr:MAG: glycosyltransferase [Candidatus Thiocaldithrix dubininis]
MKKTALFIHDHIFYKIDDAYYSNGGLPKEIWLRYLKYFDNIIVIGRQGNIPNKSMVLSSQENVEFKLIKNSLINNERKKTIVNEINNVSHIIVRLPSRLGLIALRHARGKKILIEVVGCAFEALWYHGSILGKLYAPIMYLQTKRAVKNSQSTIYVTQKFLQDRYPSSCNVTIAACSNVEISKTSEDILKNRELKILNSSQEEINIGIVASLNSKYKGLNTLFKSIKEIIKQEKNVRLHIVGGGNTEKWEALAKNLNIRKNVSFEGILNNKEAMFRWMDKLDIYIQPSLTEGLPRALIEAMSRGLPAIASNVGGIPELLKDDYLIEPKNSNDLSFKISRFLSNRDLLLSAAKENFKTAEKYEKSKIDQRRDVVIANFSKDF